MGDITFVNTTLTSEGGWSGGVRVNLKCPGHFDISDINTSISATH